MKNLTAANRDRVILSQYNFIKGRLAEAIVERAIIAVGWIPQYNGIEVRDAYFAHLRRNGKLSKNRRQQYEFSSDFYAITGDESDDQKQHYAIEVKFRTSGKIYKNEFDKYDDPNMLFVLLDLERMYCATHQDIVDQSEEDSVSFSQLEFLEDYPLFAFNDWQKEAIRTCSSFIESTLKKIDTQKEMEEKISMSESNLN